MEKGEASKKNRRSPDEKAGGAGKGGLIGEHLLHIFVPISPAPNASGPRHEPKHEPKLARQHIMAKAIGEAARAETAFIKGQKSLWTSAKSRQFAKLHLRGGISKEDCKRCFSPRQGQWEKRLTSI